MRFPKLLALAFIAACTGTTGYVVVHEPPPSRDEAVVYRPGYFFVHGRWTRQYDRWSWRPGYYVQERPGYVWVDGRWEQRGRGYYWREGTWRTRGGIVIREQRRF